AAVDAADPDSTISVAPETFTESNINITKNLTLSGEGVDQTVIDANQNGRILNVRDGAVVTITGMTLRNGHDASFQGGGGIAVWNSTLHLATCNVSGNSVAGNVGAGGLIYREGATGSIDDCLVENNQAGKNGGGLLLYQGSSLTVTNSTFRGNSAGDVGGGLSAKKGDGQVTISDSTFEANTASGGGSDIAADDTTTITVSSSSFQGECIANGTGTLTDGGGNSGTCFN
ncbi:MAG: hypothetical protein GY720_00370, partial [bacterium]|nr:hypothetical protein [bacterium]